MHMLSNIFLWQTDCHLIKLKKFTIFNKHYHLLLNSGRNSSGFTFVLFKITALCFASIFILCVTGLKNLTKLETSCFVGAWQTTLTTYQSSCSERADGFWK